MKKILAIALALVLVVALAACGTTDKSTSTAEQSASPSASAELSGTISTNGSTSMEKVIGALSEQFMADNTGVTVTYDPTGSGTGIESVRNGS